MNLFQLVLKQMRQRSLSTWLTLLSVLLGVALAIAIMILRREAQNLFGQTDYGYDVLIGPKASPLQLVLNTAYHIDKSPGVIPYSMYESLSGPDFKRMVRLAVPFGVGDSYKGQRIVGTLPTLFGIAEDGSRMPDDRAFHYRPGQRYELAQGRVFHPEKFEAVIGAEVTNVTGLKLGDQFKATHGMPKPGQTPDEHDVLWTVVGVLQPTHTANDRVLFIPLTSFYAISEHEDAMATISKIRGAGAAATDGSKNATSKPLEDLLSPTSGPAPAEEPKHYSLNADGTIHLDLPKNQWMISALLVQSRGAFNASSLMYQINNGQDAMAVNPATVMREFFSNFLEPGTKMWLLVAILVTLVASVSILVSIYNSIVARLREIAILRALGATRRRILAQICLEAGLIGVTGAIIGLILGHMLAAAGSAYMRRLMGEGINWTRIGSEEALYLVAVAVIAVLAGFVPAMKAYRTPVATNLVSG